MRKAGGHAVDLFAPALARRTSVAADAPRSGCTTLDAPALPMDSVAVRTVPPGSQVRPPTSTPAATRTRRRADRDPRPSSVFAAGPRAAGRAAATRDLLREAEVEQVLQVRWQAVAGPFWGGRWDSR
jgi:hypothetical protein